MTTVADIEARIGGFSYPSKMPCASWSTPNSKCGVGSKLRKQEGTICNLCYASNGTYNFRSTVDAMAQRYSILSAALKNPAKMESFIADFAWLLNYKAARVRRKLARGGKPAIDWRHFRWHDSGDVQGITHLEAIVEIANRCPSVAFWLPTKEAGTVKAFLVAGGVFPANLTVRLSVPRIGDVIPRGYLRIAEMSDRVAFAGAHAKLSDMPNSFSECPAYTNDGACGDCRNCWNSDSHVSYPLH